MKFIALLLILATPVEAKTIVFGPLHCSGMSCPNYIEKLSRPSADIEWITIDKIYGRVTVKADSMTYITQGMMQNIPEGELNVLTLYGSNGSEITVTFSYTTSPPHLNGAKGQLYRVDLEYCKIDIPDSRKP